MRGFSSGLFRKFLLAMAALGVVPAIFMGLQLVRISRAGLQSSVLELHTHLAEKTAGQVSIYLQNLDHSLRFALSAIQKPLDWQARQELLRSLVESHKDIAQISILSRGQEVLRVYNSDLTLQEETQTLAQDAAYQEYRQTRRHTLRIVALPDQAPRLTIYSPFSPIADIRVSLALNTLWESIRNLSFGGTGFAMLVGEGGAALIYPSQRLPPAARTDLAQWPIVLAALKAKSVGSSEYKSQDGRMQVGAYAPVPEISGAVVIQQPKDEAYWAAARMKETAVWILLGVCVAALLVSALLARTLTRPLLALSRSSQELAEGRFPEPVTLRTGDELQDFAEVFNRMVARLRQYAEMQVDRLLLEQKKTEAILFSINDGIVMTDEEGKIQLANRKAKEILGQGEFLEGKTLSQVLPEGSALKAAVLEVVQKRSHDLVKEVNLSSEARRLFIRVSARPLLSPSKGTVLGVVTALHDVTLVKELDKMKEDFLHSITHDLRNPLGSIIGFLEFLRKGIAGVLNPQQSGMVESMNKSAGRLMTLVNNILDLAKMESGRVAVKLKTVSLAGLASHAVEILSAHAQRRDIQLELMAEEEFSAEMDDDQIERVLMNLVGNAIKFSPDEGKVTVTVTQEGEHLKVCVADQGPGIPPAYLEKIFQKFEQVPGQRRGGTGLGLTISKLFVEAHQGRIWVESQEGQGSRFYFTLPRNLIQAESGEVAMRSTVADGR